MGKCLNSCSRAGSVPGQAVLLVAAAMLLLHIYNTPIPEGCQNPVGMRLALASWRLGVIIIETVGWIFGIDNGYIFFKYAVVLAPPGILTYDVKASDSLFNGVKVRVYEPPRMLPENNRALVIYHGGGWLVGNLELIDSFSRRISNATNSVIVSVDYRLAPEYVFPVPLDDCIAATTFFLEHAKDYKVNPRRVAVAGDSAGGNLAAAVALSLRDMHFTPQPAAQLLLYPAPQALDLDTPSYQKNIHDPILTTDNMAGFWLLYAQGHTANRAQVTANNHTTPEVKARLRETVLNYDNLPAGMVQDTFNPGNVSFGNAKVWDTLKDVFANPYFSPLLAESLEGLPPSLVVSMGQDVLRDDSAFYAHRLKQARNKVKYVNYVAGYHGMVSYALPLIDTDEVFNIVNTYIEETL